MLLSNYSLLKNCDSKNIKTIDMPVRIERPVHPGKISEHIPVERTTVEQKLINVLREVGLEVERIVERIQIIVVKKRQPLSPRRVTSWEKRKEKETIVYCITVFM